MIPPCPKILETLSRTNSGHPSGIEAAVAALKRDCGLADEVLAAARSPVFDAASTSPSIEEVIEQRGTDWFRSTLVALLLKRDLCARGIPDFTSAWNAVVARAMIVAHLARELRAANVYEAYSYGIFRDSGAVLMMSRYREYRLRHARLERADAVDLPRFERAVYGVDHAALGTHWAKQWMLPKRIWLPISMHHVRGDIVSHPLDHDDLTRRLVAIGALADVIEGLRRNPWADALWRREQTFALHVLGISQSQLDALTGQAEILLTFP